MQSGEVVYKADRYLPPGAFVTDELLPQTMLPGLRVGQTWTTPVYNPFLPKENPMEILQVEVERTDKTLWNGEPVPAMLVVYRSDSGSSLASHHEARGKLWVRPDGMVLKQEMRFLSSPLWFVRLTDEHGARVAEALGKDWHADFPAWRAKELLQEVSDRAPPANHR